MNLKILLVKKWALAVLTGLFVIVISNIITQTPPFLTLEYKVTDWLFQLRGPIDISESPIVLVAISDQSDYELDKPWPWPRNYHARLIDNLNAAGAKVIGFDVTFIQSDIYNHQNDTLLAEAIQRHGNVVLSGDIRSEHRAGISQLRQFIPPFRLLQQYNPNPWGVISSPADNDGFIRRYRPVYQHQGNDHFAFGLELLRKYLDLDTLDVLISEEHYDFGFIRIPVFDHVGMLINYHGASGTFTEFQYDQIIDDGEFLLTSDRDFFGINHPDEKEFGTFDDPEFGLLHSGALENKIVIVGSTIPELQDFHATPFSPRLPGYEIQANAIQTILSGNFIERIPALYMLFFVFIFSLTVILITTYRGVLSGFVFMVLFSTIVLAGAHILFSRFHMRMELVMPLLTLLLGFTFSTTYSFLFEQREKRRIRRMFDSYVSPELVKTMIESGEEPSLGGNEVYITAFFSDIRAFSTISEKLPPPQLVELINEYLSEMTDILHQEQGTLDKYNGDSIIAFFGAPVPMDDHALRACVTSQHMQLKQAELRERWKRHGNRWPDITSQMITRIGINTGWMVTGNMGSRTLFNYTMMGDNVNLAARCESGAEENGVHTMVTEKTKIEAEKFGNDCVFRYLGKILVSGRIQPVKVYEIVGLRSMIDQKTMQCIEMFEAGMADYMSRRWDKAIRFFNESARLELHQPSIGIKTNPSLLMIDRCQKMVEDHPGENWDGVFVMKNK